MELAARIRSEVMNVGLCWLKRLVKFASKPSRSRSLFLLTCISCTMLKSDWLKTGVRPRLPRPSTYIGMSLSVVTSWLTGVPLMTRKNPPICVPNLKLFAP